MKSFGKKTKNCFARTHFVGKLFRVTNDNKYIVSGSQDKQ